MRAMSTTPSRPYADLDLELMQQRAYDDVLQAIAEHAQPDYASATDAFARALGQRYEHWVGRWVLAAGAAYWLVAAPLLLQFSLWTLALCPVVVLGAPMISTHQAKRMEHRARAAIAAGHPSQPQLQIATALVARGPMRTARAWMAGSVEELSRTLTEMAAAVDCGTLGKHIVGCPHSRVQW